MHELLEENPGRLLCLFFPSSQQGDRLPGSKERQAQESGLHGVSSETPRPHPGQRGEAELPELTAFPEKCYVSDEGQQLFPGLADRQPASSKLLLPKAAGLWGPWISCMRPARLPAHLENTRRVWRQSWGLPTCPGLPEPSSRARTWKDVAGQQWLVS